MKHQFDAFIDDLKGTHGRNLASVVLYGSAATGDFIKNQSDYNLLIALHKITPEDLRAAQAPMREWSRLGHSVPVYFTVSELQNAADVFPIEFHQMEQAHIVLYGENVLAALNISDEYLRHQTEYELRSKLIKLRRAFIPASTSKQSLTALMANSLPDFIALLRAVLLLHNVAPPIAKHEIVAATAQHLKIDGEPFEKILDFKENNTAKTLDDKSVNQLFADYMQQIEYVVEAVDKV
ncbi:MAG: hypothetical protein M3521_02210 [Acidobacteriota bacterium]|nr:hypothetical protein [Acidobacteriota bacterium]